MPHATHLELKAQQKIQLDADFSDAGFATKP